MIQPPALLISAILATVYGLVLFVWRGHGARDLVYFWLASAAGFAVGQAAGQMLELAPWTIGQVHVVEGTLLALLFLALASWLKLKDAKP